MRGLSGKVGIVAGGGRGIGAATARRLSAEGAAVVIGDIVEEWALDTAQTLRAAGGKVIGMRLDGTSAASQAGIVAAALAEFGGLDFYHSNLAGGTEGDIDVLNCTEEVLDRSFAINAKSHFLATQAALPVLLERGGGAMIYTSSGAAISGNPLQVAYPMTKNALHALVRHVARKFGKKGVRANGICPGVVMTEAVAQHLTDDYVAGMLDAIPHRRLGQPDDIAGAVAFLASDDGEWVNGQLWHVNGGSLLRD
ncbi:NAD(P)-dependent dehydrogenase (short-subunit alcohol dehydrogenase family) [Novosphingobium sp. PhB165]|uniref:SDR family NAD(P)-dependent oxidoreductase n=1 Tax=Novosphingobium sp. PhB165 TaxID=2485105 RepID=UPI0010533BF3|nr:SDR family oxidoreductase [Novosphingobium sp. PhB165]TCM14700.1 NAD(P)-dependent dehydrogenase (short-subunit alcohol dehydrogenase family) [Novosphingobium sp. PhB165]